MSVKRIFLPFVAAFIVITPSFGGDIISCDSFENCPDGSVPLTNALLELEARVDALEGKAGNRISNEQIALLQWYQDPGAAAVYDTLSFPRGVAFDGTSIWITNRGSDKVSKMNPVDGTRVDYDTLHYPWGLAFDGTSIWITNSGSEKVSKMNPVDGTRVDYDTLSDPYGVAFDGTSIWITNWGSDKVSKMNPVDGTRVDYDTLSHPYGVAFDGTSIWITNSGSEKVSKMNPGY